MDGSANSAVLTRRIRAKVDLTLTMPSHVPGLAVTMIIIDQLHAIQSPRSRARIGKTLVDVSLAPGPDESRRALAIETADPIDAGPVIVASPWRAVVVVDLAKVAQGARGTGALEVVDEVVARAAILARVGLAVVDVQLAVLALEALGAVASVGADQVLAGGAVLAGGRLAFVDLALAVRARVAL